MVMVLGVSSSTLTAVAVRTVVSDQADLKLVDVVASGRQAQERCAERGIQGTREIDVVLMDTYLPGEDSLRLATGLREAHPGLGVVLIGPAEDRVLVRAAVAGISGYLPANVPVHVLLAAIRRAAVAPDSFTAPDLAGVLRRPQTRARLSAREGEVLRHLLTGSTLATIADTMLVSESTIKTYASRIYRKLGVRDRGQAVDAAIRAGLVQRCGPDLSREPEPTAIRV
ncbi:MAG: response regulator transcription factor [Micromonosporaceae bacterium]|nr:response regulator transcription factor [Micromonosporaceae bacterium]